MPEVAQIASTAWWQKWKPVRCRRYRNLFVLDHGLPPQIGKIAVSLDAESFFENLVSNLLQPGGVGLRLFLRANGEHLYALRGLFRGRQMSNLDIVEDAAQSRWQVGGRLDDRITHGDFGKPARERNPIGAVRKAAA